MQEHSRMHIISRSFRAQRSVAMNPRQLALFLGFYFYVLNVNAANDAQRIILPASLVQIRALQHNFFCGTNDDEEDAACIETYFQQFVDDFRFDSASKITALSYRSCASFRLVWSGLMLK